MCIYVISDVTFGRRRRELAKRLRGNNEGLTAGALSMLETAFGIDHDYTPLEEVVFSYGQLPEEPLHLVGGLIKAHIIALVEALSTFGKACQV